MNLIFAKQNILENLTNSIFLAGPTPRDRETKSWRPEAIEIFQRFDFDGTLLIPEDIDGEFRGSYDDQVEWEEKGLAQASCIMFWLPRNKDTMLGLTSNDEFGTWKKSGKVVLGVPDGAFRCSYQKYYAKKLGIPLSNFLEKTIELAIKMVLTKEVL